MTRTRPESPLALLRECQDREFRSEGIPMVLALVSEVGDVPAAGDAGVRADGERLASSIDDFREALVPTARDLDSGCTISVLQAVSYDDFGWEIRP